MAQRGRPSKTDSRPKPSSDQRTEYYCSRCGRAYPQQRGNFPYNQSSLYEGNNHYATLCYTCVDELFDHYTETLGSEVAALRRICSKLDMYFNPEVFAMTEKTNVDTSRFAMYVSRLSLRAYKGKTYDTTLDEEKDLSGNDARSSVTKKTKKFFGDGFEESDYQFLEAQYTDWITRYECQTKAQEELFKNLSFAQLNIVKAQREGKKVKDAQDAFQQLLRTQNITPSQRNDNALADQNTFGTLIRKWETERPISDPLPEWQDVDGIVRYITVYFLGHLCKMIGLKNRYSRMYDQEMEKYRVERPEYEEDDEALFDSVFGGHVNE